MAAHAAGARRWRAGPRPAPHHRPREVAACGGPRGAAPNWIFAPKDLERGAPLAGDSAADVGEAAGSFIRRGARRSPTGRPASEELGLQRMGRADAAGLVVRAVTGAGTVVYGDRAAAAGADEPAIRYSPRRTMAVRFTCNRCGTRTERRINPKAYSDGTVFVQCSGCDVHHKLVDNLNLYFEGDRFLSREAEQAAGGRLDASALIEVFPRVPRPGAGGGPQIFKMRNSGAGDGDGAEGGAEGGEGPGPGAT